MKTNSYPMKTNNPRILPKLREHRRILASSIAALMAMTSTSSHAVISIGNTPLTLTFDAAPGVGDWSTITTGIAGGGLTFVDVASLEIGVAALTEAGISNPLPTSGTNPPSTNAAGRYNTALQALQTRPTGNAAAVLLGRLQNANGVGISDLSVSYSLSRFNNAVVEQIDGLRAFFSITGAANSWTSLPLLSGGVAGSLTQSFATSGWGAGGNAYILFVDDNADPGTDDGFTIDNLSFTPTLLPPPTSLVWNLAHSVGGAPDGNLEVSAAQYWTKSGPQGYADGEVIEFSQNPATVALINVPASVAPASVKITHTSGGYTVGGTGQITTGLLTKSGAGTVTFTSQNAFGNVSLEGGTVATQNALSLGNATITLVAPTTLQTDADLTVSGLAGNSSITKTGAGVLTLSQASSGTTSVTVNDGSLRVLTGAGLIGVTANLDAKTLGFGHAAGDQTVGAGALVNIGAGGLTVGVETAGAGVIIGAANTLSGSATITKTGPGQLRLRANQNTFTGNWIVNDGVLEYGGDPATVTNPIGTGTVTVNPQGLFSTQNRAVASTTSVILAGGAIASRTGDLGDFQSPISVTAPSRLATLSASTPADSRGFLVSGLISGSSPLTVVGPAPAVGTGLIIDSRPVAAFGNTAPGAIIGNVGNTFSGGFIVTARQVLTAQPGAGTGNPLGTGAISLNSGTLRIRDNGTGNNGTLAYGQNIDISTAAAPNAVSSVIDVDRQLTGALGVVAGGTFSGNTAAFGTLGITGGSTLTTTGANGYGARFDGAATTTGTGAVTFDIQTAPLSLAGGLTGSTDIIKNGAGTLTLIGAVSYTGNTAVNAGTLDVSGVTGGFTIAGTKTLSGQGTISGPLKIANGGIVAPGNALGVGNLNVLNFTAGSAPGDVIDLNYTFSGALTGMLNVTQTEGFVINGGPSSIRLNFAGVSAVVGETYELLDYVGTPLADTSAFTIANIFSRINASIVNNTIDTRVDLLVNSINFPKWTGDATTEWSTNTIAAPKNWSLTTGGAATDFIAADRVLFDDTATGAAPIVDIAVADVLPIAVEFNNSTKDYTLQGAFGISGAVPFTKNGSGKVTISNTNSFTGALTVNAGTLSVASISDSGVNGTLGGGTGIALAGGALEFTGITGSTNRALATSGTGGTVTTPSGSTLTLAGVVSGTGGFTKAGAGTVILSNAANTADAITIAQGTLQIGDGTAAGSTGAGAITNNATLSFNTPAANLAIVNTITGTGGLTKVGAGNLSLGGAAANTFAGTTTVTEGTLTANKAAGTNAIGGNLLINGGNFRYAGNNVGNQIPDLATVTLDSGTFGDVTAAGVNPTNPGSAETIASLFVNGGTFNTGRATFTANTEVKISGGLAQVHRGGLLVAQKLTVEGAGVLDIDGAVTTGNPIRARVNGGGLTLNSGIINLNQSVGAAVAANSVGTRIELNGDVTSSGTSSFVRLNPTFAVPAELDLVGGSRTFNVDGVLNVGTVVAPVAIVNTVTATPSGIIKDGVGTLVLAGVNTYNGDTVVRAGTLALSGTISGSANIDVQSSTLLDVTAVSGGFSVAGAQTLKGNGTLVGDTTINGTLSPGASIGTLIFTEDLTFGSSGLAAFEINKTGLSLTSDIAEVTGTLTLGGSLNVSTFGTSSPLVEGDTFDLFNAAAFAGSMTMGTMPALDPGLSWDISDLGVDGTITVIPEPGSAALLVLGGALLFRRRRTS
jgi:fibronectin-binding autotransporter adhesin